MKNKTLVSKYYGQSNKIFGSILMIGIMVLLVGFSYAFFVYNKTGLYTHTITGGKMSIIYNETTGNNITIDNAYPLRDEEALTKGLEFEFTISGYNESDKNIYYAIEMDYGEDVNGKERFLDNNIKLSLYENDEEVFGNQVFANLDNQDIHYGVINQGTSVDSPVTNNYKLRIWINDYVIISDTVSDDLSTWTDFEWDWLEEYNKKVYNFIMDSDNQYLSEYGISIYTTSEFQNMYANFKVNVTADLTYDDVGFITYDANGGEFTPEKTSLTTGRITTQKPVMRTEVASQTGTNLKGKVTQIENEVEYQYRGFLGWSSTPDGEVEYKAGDYYSGNGEILYAIYDDGVNIMENLEAFYGYESTIIEIHFINDTINNIVERYNNASIKFDLTHNDYIDKGQVLSWIEEDEDGNDILYIGSNGTIYLTDCANMFYNYNSLNLIDFENADTSMVTDMSGMFATYALITEKGNDNIETHVKPLFFEDNEFNATTIADDSVDFMIIEHLDAIRTDNVLTMEYMFRNSNVVDLDLSNFNAGKVTNMLGMFSGCCNLVSLNISNINTENVEDMSKMFYHCWNLTELNLNKIDTKSVTDMSSMFEECYNLKKIDVSNFNTSNVINMSNMFESCTNLTMLDVSKWDTSMVESMLGMFSQCSNLISLDLSKWDTSNVTSMNGMFSYCISITELNLSSFNTSKVEEFGFMFKGCSNLIVLNLSKFNTMKVISTDSMFSNCDNIEIIYCNNVWSIDDITDSRYMFMGCDKLIGAVPYDSTKINITMANPDTGYFTYKTN